MVFAGRVGARDGGGGWEGGFVAPGAAGTALGRPGGRSWGSGGWARGGRGIVCSGDCGEVYGGLEGELDWVGLCRWEEDWLVGLCARVRLEPACKPPHKGILGRVVVFLVGVAVGDRGDGALQV
jgi:hypothetical protein